MLCGWLGAGLRGLELTRSVCCSQSFIDLAGKKRGRRVLTELRKHSVSHVQLHRLPQSESPPGDNIVHHPLIRAVLSFAPVYAY